VSVAPGPYRYSHTDSLLETLLTYATTLAFYLHMRATPKYAANPKLLQTHPVLSRLLSLKQAMASLERLDFGPNSDGDEGSEDIEEDDMRVLWGDWDLAEMGEEEFRELMREAQELNVPQPLKKEKKKNTEGLPNGDSNHKKSKFGEKEKQKKSKKSKKPVFDLEEPEFIPASALNGTASSSTKSKPSPHSISAFGEYTSLDATDAQDKSARKKSLRFHTTKIESASSRRAKARGAAMGGDDDIPYKARERAKEARLAAESARKLEKGLLGQGGEDLEDVQEGRGVKRAREDEGADGEVGVDGYYELVKRQKRDQRDEKKVQYDAQKAAEKYVS
jgi:U3 small nucleolar RNA-associated protein 3